MTNLPPVTVSVFQDHLDRGRPLRRHAHIVGAPGQPVSAERDPGGCHGGRALWLGITPSAIRAKLSLAEPPSG